MSVLDKRHQKSKVIAARKSLTVLAREGVLRSEYAVKYVPSDRTLTENAAMQVRYRFAALDGFFTDLDGYVGCAASNCNQLQGSEGSLQALQKESQCVHSHTAGSPNLSASEQAEIMAL